MAVIILALINYLEAGTLLLFGAALLLLARLIAELDGAGMEMPPGSEWLLPYLLRLWSAGGMALMLGVVGLPALVLIVVGVGLWRLRNWARVSNIFLTAVKLLLLLLASLLTLHATPAYFLGLELLQAAVYAWIIWYLFQPPVKQAFGAA